MDILLEKGKELQLPYKDKVYKHTVDLVFCSDTEQELEELTKLKLWSNCPRHNFLRLSEL